jgi:hypothetical protein
VSSASLITSGALCVAAMDRARRAASIASSWRAAIIRRAARFAYAWASSMPAGSGSREVVQRPERARGEQAVARAPGPAGITKLPLEPFEPGGLADASLPAEDDQTPVAPPGLGRTVGQQGQRRLPLQQFHASGVGHPRSWCHYGRSSE